ncbi:MAG: hypothetical protein EOO90_17320 [Pedobacter sp.]|nr:MAG: hypothetical protein EOO90_17320 [Pedobacter sp.]
MVKMVGRPRRSKSTWRTVALNQNEMAHATNAMSSNCQMPASTKPITVLLENKYGSAELRSIAPIIQAINAGIDTVIS